MARSCRPGADKRFLRRVSDPQWSRDRLPAGLASMVLESLAAFLVRNLR